MLGLGKLNEVYFEGLDKTVSNMTLGIHAQEWLSKPLPDGSIVSINQLFIGLFFFRIVFEFVKE